MKMKPKEFAICNFQFVIPQGVYRVWQIQNGWIVPRKSEIQNGFTKVYRIKFKKRKNDRIKQKIRFWVYKSEKSVNRIF